MWRCALSVLVVLVAAACGNDTYERPEPDDNFFDTGWQGGTDSGQPGVPGTDADARGPADSIGGRDVEPGVLQEWSMLCAGCHGDEGQGGLGPAVGGTALSLDQLVAAIDARMPSADPSLCEDDCARRMAEFILALGPPELSECSVPALAPRRLRLLTRHEYNATIEGLLRPDAIERPGCGSDVDCHWESEVCERATCDLPNCGVGVFVLRQADARGATDVSVAGSFNEWASSGPDALPLVWESELSAWRLVADIGEGTHRYKFVLNSGSEWIADPRALESEDDGFGDRNSVLRVACSSEADDGSRDWAAEVPNETRPTGFYYDSHAASARVTTSHLEAYFAAAERAASEVARSTDRLVGCDDPGDRSCLELIAGRLAQSLYRRTSTGSELGELVSFVVQTQSDHGGDAFEILTTTMLMHPDFLYRREFGEVEEGGLYVLTGREIADLMAYALTGGPPDSELEEAADAGLLVDAAERRAQARRLLQSSAARQQIRRFATQWLGIESLPAVTRNLTIFPDFNARLATLMQAETERFVEYVVLEADGGIRELLTANYSFVDRSLAALYGLDERGLSSGVVEQVSLGAATGSRGGLLGHGSILTATSHSDQTSPIRRGLFVRQRMLCQEFGTPPANAGGVPDVDPSATTRERFRQHTDNPSCFSCHRYIDDLGFGFERYDAIGAYRTSENGLGIESQGNMNDVEGFGTGTEYSFTDLHALGAYLAESDAMQRCFVHQYTRFIVGSYDAQTDLCADAAVSSQWDAETDSIADLIETLVASAAFITRWPEEE